MRILPCRPFFMVTAMTKKVTFTLKDNHKPDGLYFEVEPSLENIRREENGEGILMSIAANCLRMVAKGQGLDRALDLLSDFAMNKTRVVK